MVAVDQPMESILKCEKRSSDHGDSEQIGIVRMFYLSPEFHSRARRSVSSVNTLEEAKVTKGCLYAQVPVQEACQYPFLPRLTVLTFSR